MKEWDNSEVVQGKREAKDFLPGFALLERLPLPGEFGSLPRPGGSWGYQRLFMDHLKLNDGS